jgi:heme exporter protein CcmB
VLIVVVLFSFTFEPTSNESHRFGPGLLWLAFLFAASLMLQPCFLREHVNDTLSALRLAASDPFAIFLAKIGANTLFLLLTELIMLPVFAVLFNVHFRSQLSALLLTFSLGSLGVATAGTALAAISTQAKMRELLLPVLLLPVLAPILIAPRKSPEPDGAAFMEWKGITSFLMLTWCFWALVWRISSGGTAGRITRNGKRLIFGALGCPGEPGGLRRFTLPDERTMGVIQRILFSCCGCLVQNHVSVAFANLRMSGNANRNTIGWE